MDLVIVRNELVISLSWARDNPVLFTQAVDKFIDDHPPELWSYKFTSPYRGGIVYTAYRKEHCL